MKKLISVLLAAACFLCQLPIIAEETDGLNQEIVYTEKEQEAFGILEVLGIFQKDDETVNNYVTRGEFTEYALRFGGISSTEISQSESPLRFPDVVNSDYRAAVSLAADRGLAAGYSDGYFYPDNYITLDEAANIIGNVLGYGLGNGKISTHEITLGVTAGENGAITYRAMAKLLYNALDCQTLSTDFSEKGSYGFGKTALKSFFNAESATGVVTANDTTSLTEKAGCNDNYIVMDGVSYYDPNGLAWEMLGYRAKLYYRENEADDFEIIYALKSRNTVLTVDADDISDETTITDFCYEVDEREKHFSISPTIRVIENYTLAVPHTDAMFKPADGEVIFIDNNNDGTYEVALSNSYKDYFVSGTDTVNGVIYDKYGKDNIETEDKKTVIEKDGKKLDISAITVGSIASVYASDNYVRIEISTKTVSGQPSSVKSEGNKRYVTVSGEKYISSGSYETAVTGKRANDVKMGSAGTFYINFEGKLAAFVGSESGVNYGFLTRSYASEDIDDEVWVKLIDSSGQLQTYMLYEKARVYVGKTEYRLDKVGGAFVVGELTKDQLVKYDVNKSIVKKIYISDGYEVADFTTDTDNVLNMTKSVTSGYYNSNATCADNEWYCGEGTIIFGIPRDSGGSVIYEDIKVYEPTKITSDSYAMKLYDSNEKKMPKAMVIYNANRNSNNKLYYDYKNFFVVKNKYETINEDYETVSVLEGYYLGSPVTYTTTDTTLFADFEKGDIGQVALCDKEVCAARVFYKNKDIAADSWSDKKITYKNTFHKRDVYNYGFSENDSIYTNKSSECMFVHAKVLEANSNYVTVQYSSDSLDTAMTPNKGFTVLTYPIKSWTKVYKVSQNRSEISVASSTVNEARWSSGFGSLNGSRVILNVRAQRIDEMFIME